MVMYHNKAYGKALYGTYMVMYNINMVIYHNKAYGKVLYYTYMVMYNIWYGYLP